MTYEPEASDIIFPVIQPFGENIPKLLEDYKYQAIYDTTKYYLSPEGKFIIKDRYKY